jgi:hypothetical protein
MDGREAAAQSFARCALPAGRTQGEAGVIVRRAATAARQRSAHNVPATRQSDWLAGAQPTRPPTAIAMHCSTAGSTHSRLTNVLPSGGACAACCSCCAEAVCASCARLSSISARRFFVILRCHVSKSSPGAGGGMRAGTHGRYTAGRGGARRAAVVVGGGERERG